MSVDTCQKYSLCPEKAVCGVTAVRLPRTLNLPPPLPPLHDSVQPRKKASCVSPEGEREQEGASREGHQHYSAGINAFPPSVSPHCTAIVLRKSIEGFCVCVSEDSKERQTAIMCLCTDGSRGSLPLEYSTRTNHLTNLSALQSFSINSTTMN